MTLTNIDSLVNDNIRILKLPTAKLNKPTSLCFVGIPGTGKSTLVSALTKTHPFAVLSDEAMLHFLMPYKATFFDHSQEETFELAAKTIEKLIQDKISVIYDSSLKKRVFRDMIKDLVLKAGGVFILVYLKADKELAFKRVEKSNIVISRGEKKGFILSRDLFEYEVLSTEPPFSDEEHLTYDSTEENALERIKEQIRVKIG